ncbi:hypothetical protein GH714_027956 [Hevea brasiliensis]|uniref:Uncharacterized protein n=1 Tax=Hevea brasiliensis TaxID=3981 RepID=A0A6A6N334_HEVBR|nr:hypothetical protein GH714_027956 [Hevea brasiliensis]
MASSNNSLGNGPPMFNGENYHIWEIKMKSYLKALNLWDAVENGADPPPLGPNPTLNQIKNFEEASVRKPKALTCLHSSVTDVIFTRIMAYETPKEVWDKLKEEFEGSDRVKKVKLRTLKREFEMLRMKEDETVKQYASKLMELTRSLELQQNKANQQQLAQDQFLDPTVIKVDNQSAILIAKNPVQHGRTKHIQFLGGGERKGIEGIVVGIVGMEGMLGSGGKVTWGTAGMVGRLGSGGSVGLGNGGNVGLGKEGTVGLGKFGTKGRGDNCRRWRAATATLMLENDKAMKSTRMKKLKEAILK